MYSPSLKPVRNAVAAVEKHQDAAALQQAAGEMESLFLYQLLEIMRDTVPESGFLSGGAGEKTFRPLMHMALAGNLASAGGLGLGDMLYGYLSENPSEAERAPGEDGENDLSPLFPVKSGS